MANDLPTVKSHIDEASSIIVGIPENPGKDVVASALALYLSLKNYGKEVAVISTSSPVVRDSRLVGLDKVTSDVGGKNLVMTVNAPEDAVEKVTSNTEGGHLNLIIIPKAGSKALKAEDITFGYTGAAADLIIVVGASTISDMGAISEKEIELFTSAPIINLSNKNGSFGVVNLTDETSSNSELVAAMLQELHLPMDVDTAGNLMQGIEDATSNLTATSMTADTFEAMAVLYRAGARRSAPSEARNAKVVSDFPIVDHGEPSRIVPPPIPPQVKSENKTEWLKPKIMKTEDK